MNTKSVVLPEERKLVDEILEHVKNNPDDYWSLFGTLSGAFDTAIKVEDTMHYYYLKIE